MNVGVRDGIWEEYFRQKLSSELAFLVQLQVVKVALKVNLVSGREKLLLYSLSLLTFIFCVTHQATK